MPNNEAELQLYRVLQRASLLSYYDTLLEMGMTQIILLIDQKSTKTYNLK